MRAHLADLAPTAPPESRHALDLAALRSPAVRLWVLRHRGAIAATGALAALEPGHEELKSMRTDPALRGRGLGRAMLTHLLHDAATRGVTRISLETGSMPCFAPARRLYTAAGFTPCPPFGNYLPDPNSSFFTLLLEDQGD
ncbi:GNAT family N-acetyltransferase [Nocardia jiangsuensis]|uniref:GNAT family N-acetyltransferase n=1 Tax=Nocardia jiangsuensis TaxID=1691563 RepID=A0ABV8DTT0_9NOCA